MTDEIQLLAVVALTQDLPAHCLARGQVGTVAELLAPDVFEVEFCDDAGRTCASLPVRADQLMVVHNRPLSALYVIALSALLLLFVGIHNAWDAAIFMAMRRRDPPAAPATDRKTE